MGKLRNLSIKKTIFVYMLTCLLCSCFLSAFITRFATHIQNDIWIKYVDLDSYIEAQRTENSNYLAVLPRPSASVMSSRDHFISELCDVLYTYSVLVVSIVGSGVAIFLFYHNKLKTPLDELKKASKRIAQNDLDFSITYKNQDEMGQLCREFERMKHQLMLNNQKLWKKLEEEKILRSAIAHDIRSPLTVLKGYQEMLLEYVPNQVFTTEKTVEMLSEGMKQIGRMDVFIETMRKMSSLEGRELKSSEITSSHLKEDMQGEITILSNEAGKRATFMIEDTNAVFYGDKEIILEVTENLISNALRYATEEIKIEVRIMEEKLAVCVGDDGNGFTEDGDTITKAFHQKNIKDSLEHSGLGMYISRMYCEKHNGNLVLENSETGGAVVTAIFGRIV